MILSDKLFVFHISFPIRRNGDKKQAVSGASGRGRAGESRESSSSPTPATSGAESTDKARRWKVRASRSKAVTYHSNQRDRWQWNLKELLQLQQSCWSACWFDHLFSAVINITQRMRCDKSRGQHLTCKIKQLRQGAWVQLVNNWRSGKALMLAPGRQK